MGRWKKRKIYSPNFRIRQNIYQKRKKEPKVLSNIFRGDQYKNEVTSNQTKALDAYAFSINRFEPQKRESPAFFSKACQTSRISFFERPDVLPPAGFYIFWEKPLIKTFVQVFQ